MQAFTIDALGQTTDLSRVAGDLAAIAINRDGDVLLSGPHVICGGKFAAISAASVGWKITSVGRINDNGTVIGQAAGPDGAYHAVVLTPPSP